MVHPCRPLAHGEALLAVEGHGRLIVTGLQVRRLGLRNAISKAALAAFADLSGTHLLYVDELVARLNHGRNVVDGTTRLDGTLLYRVELVSPSPKVWLLVRPRDLTPIAAVYRARALSGVARFAPVTQARRPESC